MDKLECLEMMELVESIKFRTDELEEFLCEILDSFPEEEKFTMDRDREFIGEYNSFWGERGKTFVNGMRIRDICDCILRGTLLANAHNHKDFYEEASKGEKADLAPTDLYHASFHNVDPVAVIQNIMCEIEKMMGIYPNIPELQPVDVDEDGNEKDEEIEGIVKSKNFEGDVEDVKIYGKAKSSQEIKDDQDEINEDFSDFQDIKFGLEI